MGSFRLVCLILMVGARIAYAAETFSPAIVQRGPQLISPTTAPVPFIKWNHPGHSPIMGHTVIDRDEFMRWRAMRKQSEKSSKANQCVDLLRTENIPITFENIKLNCAEIFRVRQTLSTNNDAPAMLDPLIPQQ